MEDDELKIIEESAEEESDKEEVAEKKEVEESTQEENPEVESKVEEVAVEELKVQPIEVRKAPKISDVTEKNGFTSAIEEAKVTTVKQAAATDEGFQRDFTKELKEATLKLAELEREKAELEKQNIQYHSELLGTRQQANQHAQAEDKWNNREKRRQYHYNGVAPIMEFVGIKKPMNLFILYFLTIILLPFFLIQKLFRGTIGALMIGAEDANRGKGVRAFLWTLLAVVIMGLIALAVYLVLLWLGVVGASEESAEVVKIITGVVLSR